MSVYTVRAFSFNANQFDVLRPSATTRMEGSGMDAAVVVGYGTDYGIYVHENLNARHKPGKSAKFLTKPLHDNQDKLTKIVMKAIQEAQ